jgi:2-desacetyl-2-hydroxyethyl bacteriochlorophyllide A dehydrogenase
MGHVVQFTAPFQVATTEYEERPLKPGEVRIATLYSGISSGTELSHYRGTNPMRGKTHDPDLQLFKPGSSQPWYPRSSGYEEVGRVIEISEQGEDLQIGDVVFGTWQHFSTKIMDAQTAARQKLLPGLEPIQGIFSQIGAIALNGVLDAQINVGEVVAIFGLGTVGQIAVQLAKLSGAEVIAVDLHPHRLEMAARMGADLLINASEGSPAEAIKTHTSIGADVCLEMTGSPAALHEAIRAAAYNAKVITLGFFQDEAQGLYLGEEFHHNRIQICCSQIGGLNPLYTHRWNRARLDATIMKLQAQGKLQLKELITRIYPYQQAAQAYEQLHNQPEEVLQLVLDFQEAQDHN